MLDVKRIIAQILVDIRAVHFNIENPFEFSSKTLSPVYVDCRKIIANPKQRKIILNMASLLIEYELAEKNIDIIAGGETAGIPYAAWLAQELNLPMIYVRKEPKRFGRLAQIEGDLPENKNVLLVEDLSFNGGSKVKFCNAIRNAGANVTDTLVVFDYGVEESQSILENSNIKLHSLTNWPTLLDVVKDNGYFNEEQVQITKDFLSNPTKWSDQARNN